MLTSFSLQRKWLLPGFGFLGIFLYLYRYVYICLYIFIYVYIKMYFCVYINNFILMQSCSMDSHVLWVYWLHSKNSFHLGMSRSMFMCTSICTYTHMHSYKYICCSVAKSCLTFCDPMNSSTPGFLILYCILYNHVNV